MLTENLLAPHDTTGWGDVGISNQNWPVFLGEPYSNISVPWRGGIPDCFAYMPRIPENARAAARRVCDDFLCGRLRARMRSPSTSRNPVRNPRINSRGDDREGPAD